MTKIIFDWTPKADSDVPFAGPCRWLDPANRTPALALERFRRLFLPLYSAHSHSPHRTVLHVQGLHEPPKIPHPIPFFSNTAHELARCDLFRH